jgi:hypothetical protein
MNAELNLISRTGDNIPVVLCASLLNNKEGEPAGIVIIAKDLRE